MKKIILILSIILLVSGCITDKPKNVELYKDNYEMFNSSSLVKVEEVGDFGILFGNRITKINYLIEFNESGYYLLEGYTKRYRTHDILSESWNFTVQYNKSVCINVTHLIYRLEIYKVSNNSLSKNILFLQHHGEIGRSLTATGDEI